MSQKRSRTPSSRNSGKDASAEVDNVSVPRQRGSAKHTTTTNTNVTANTVLGASPRCSYALYTGSNRSSGVNLYYQQRQQENSATPVVAVHRGARLGSKYPHASPYLQETDFTDSLYTPHTITAGVAMLFSLLFLYQFYNSPDDVSTSIKLGLLGAALSFVFFGSIHLPDGILTRPHPVLWRILLALSILYMCILVFCFFIDPSTARMIVGYIDPALRKKLPEQSYAEDCRLSAPQEPYKFWSTICDEFLLAHAVGYWAKMLIIRDWRIVTAISFVFEVVEVSLQHVLPNFKECWWDHVIADLLICNLGGTILGLITLRLICAKRYNWVKLRDIPSLSGKVRRVLSQFRPRQVDPYEWHVFASPKRFFQILLLIACVQVQEVNCFTSKNILQLPSTHPIVISRLALWGFMSIPALREYFEYISEPECKRFGTMAWMGSIILALECLVIGKYAYVGGHFRQPTPPNVGVPLLLSLFLLVFWVVMYYGIPAMRLTLTRRRFMNIVFYSIPCVLFVMCLMTNVDLEWKKKEFNEFVYKYGLW